MKPRVFVAMPFGEKEVRPASPATEGRGASPAVSVNFTAVYEELLKPSLKLAGCEPFRADEEKVAGDIRTDMYFELVTADFVVADVSILNPNVFYELGVRHGVATGGVLHLHGDWVQQPFDIRPDRLFSYSAQLWVAGNARTDGWREEVEKEVGRLAEVLRDAIAQDRRTEGSPVYKSLPGLKPVDWHGIQSARAKYFRGVLDQWKKRIQIAQKEGWPGDILTLASDAPTRYHHGALLFKAAKALIDLCRFEAAEVVLQDLLELTPDHLEAQCQLGLVYNRVGKRSEAEVLLQQVATKHQGDPEAQGILGRLYKDSWRTAWFHEEPLDERQRAAVVSANWASTAARSYEAAQRNEIGSYYNGINVLSLTQLLRHLENVSGERGIAEEIPGVEDLLVVVRYAARTSLSKNQGASEGEQVERIWATATLGELELLVGDGKEALRLYQKVLHSPGLTSFNLNSMMSQLELMSRLGFRPEAVQPVIQALEGSERYQPQPLKRFRKVVVCSGHMVDKPGRPAARFPTSKVDAVRHAMAEFLDRWQVGKGDLAICGGARGADLLFAELCQERGIQTRLLIPKKIGDFLEESVKLPDTSYWVDRFYAMKANSEVWIQPERLGEPPEKESPFTRNNVWILNTAQVEAPPDPLYALLVWDEKEKGDGPGGTSHFAKEVRRLGGETRIVNPTKL